MNRKDRLARNETIFREVNERIRALNRGQEESLEILCECGNAACDRSVTVTTSAYEEARRHSTHFIVVHGHVIAEIEVIVTRKPGFDIVRKLPEEEAIARRTDPRS
jgi:hypothetical protein